MDEKQYIAELEAEVERLREELRRASERDRDYEDARRAMIYLLEDLNDSKNTIEKASKEWESTFDGISDIVFLHDAGMRVVRCNRAYQQAAGMKFKEIIWKPYYKVFPIMDGPFEICTRSSGVDHRLEEEQEVAVPQLNRTYKERHYSIVNPDGKYLFSVHIMEDITEAKRAAGNERALREFTQNVVTNLDIDFRLRAVCSTAVEFGYRMAWIGLLDEKKCTVVPQASAGVEDGYLSSIIIRLDDSPLSEGPVGRAVKNRASEVSDDISTDERFRPWREEALKRGYGSVAAFPIIDGDQVIAVLSVYSVEKTFPRRDLGLFHSFTSLTASYLRNSKLYRSLKESSEKIREEMELTKHLLMISSATAQTTDIDRMMGHVVSCLKSITGGDICLSYLWDNGRTAFASNQAAGLPREMTPAFKVERLESMHPLIISLFENGIPALWSSGGGLDNLFPWIKEAKWTLAIPLIGREGRLGILAAVYLAGTERFLEGLPGRDREVAEGVSHQVSTALEEARLYKESIDTAMELSRKIETIQTMGEIDRAILSTLEPQEILETATRMISKVVYCDRATISLVDREREGFVYTAGFGVSIEKGRLVPFAGTTATDIIKTGRPQYVANLKNQEFFLFLEESLLRDGYLSHMRVPLFTKGAVAGILAVGAKRAAAYTAEDLSIVEKLASQIGVALENSRLVTDLKDLFIGIVKTLSEAIDAKSPWTRGHSERVTMIALNIGRVMGLSEAELKDLELAGMLHDIGKLGTYESILDKPGRLTEEELKIMRLHPGKGADILSPIRQMSPVTSVIRHHHEFFDGTGYPDGLKGREIPPLARILAVADTVDAMGADRPYRKGKPQEAIIAELKRCSGTQFDPEVVEAFLKTGFAKWDEKVAAAN